MALKRLSAVLIGAILALCALAPAHAQVAVPAYLETATGNIKAGIGVTILPSGTSGNAASPSTNLSGTTSATPGTYTTIQALNSSRKGCTVLNTSVNPETIRVGGAALYPLPAGSTFGCGIQGSGGTISDLIEISSTVASSSYTATFQ